MSILIKGMKMPKDGCCDCIFVNRKWHGDICPILKREVTGNVERGGFQTDCPLVEVPAHGRLIDADAVEKQIDYVANLDWNIKVGVSRGMLAALEIVEDAPTVIEAEDGER